MKKAYFVLFMILVILLNIGCDQVTKDFARKNFKNKGMIRIAGDFCIIYYTENNGGFLGMGSNIPQPYKTIIMLIVPVLVLIFSLAFLFRSRDLSAAEIILACCILGGGISNIFDRIVYKGHVTDFLNFGIGSLRTGIVNFADMSITLGALLLITVHYWRSVNSSNPSFNKDR